jgi:hypothetical protein
MVLVPGIQTTCLSCEEFHSVHYLEANNTVAYISIDPERKKVLRHDFWGLMNMYNNTPRYGLTSTVEKFASSGPPSLVYHLPHARTESKEVL